VIPHCGVCILMPLNDKLIAPFASIGSGRVWLRCRTFGRSNGLFAVQYAATSQGTALLEDRICDGGDVASDPF
jgi:hypothetical protein